MPVWHEATREWVQRCGLVVLGVTQEHHADRCRLFAQWKGLDFPILHDPINLMGANGVPIVVAINERGIVLAIGPDFEDFERRFLGKGPEGVGEDAKTARGFVPSVVDLRGRAEQEDSADAWRALGDALTLWHSPGRINQAINAYSRAAKMYPRDGPSLFRLGVCYRMRYESDQRQAGDFQKAVDYWAQALATNPNQYIWRRRIQQYGPRVNKPYPFYDWVEEAIVEISARGEKPPALRVLPGGSEIAKPLREFVVAREKPAPPDPEGQISRDITGLIETEVTVVPSRLPPGGSARVHVVFRPSAPHKAHWSNDAEPLRLWVDPPKGWKVDRRLLETPQPREVRSSESRRLGFDIQAPEHAAPGRTRLVAYALYYVCEEVQGRRRLLRRDIDIEIEVAR